MKRWLVCILILSFALSLLPGCKPQTEEIVVDLTGGAQSGPAAPTDAAQGDAAAASAASFGTNAAVTVQDTAAYCFTGAEGTTLYGAISYENTGDCPVVLTGADFTFSTEGKTLQRSFTPAFAEQVVVNPGEISYATLWYKTGEATPGAPVALSATLSCAPAQTGTERLLLAVSDVFLADNYPGFTTMSGSIAAPGACELNLIYTAFYDQGGKLLGVWHFSKNVSLTAGNAKSFVVHMRELPVDGLAEKTAEVRAFAVGF